MSGSEEGEPSRRNEPGCHPGVSEFKNLVYLPENMHLSVQHTRGHTLLWAGFLTGPTEADRRSPRLRGGRTGYGRPPVTAGGADTWTIVC
jgi:hypothetical protein